MRQARIVTSIAMFYDLEDPIDFAAEIERVLADDGIWHFEQSYMPSMLRMTTPTTRSATSTSSIYSLGWSSGILRRRRHARIWTCR